MNYNKVPIIDIRRHRLLSDGSGVRTLVGFYKCPLHCSYCLNPQCHNTPKVSSFYSPQELLDMVKVDSLYFTATDGGITFGGGEPLLYSNYINDFIKIAPNNWKFSCETSLNAPISKVKIILEDINEFIVDIKDMTPDIYYRYTGKENALVLSNLRYVAKQNLCSKFLIRIPVIPKYNTQDDVQTSVKVLQDLGFSRFEHITYATNVQEAKINEEENLYNGINWGKITCEVLKEIRATIAVNHGIRFKPNKCKEKICTTGNCPACENELLALTKLIHSNNEYGQDKN